MCLSYADCKAQIDRFARRAHMRLQAAGARGYELGDVVQECAVAYVIAADRWDQASGVPFRAYLARGMQNHVNRWAEKEIGQSLGANVSLDAELGDGDDGSMTLHEAVGASHPTAEDELLASRAREYALARLTPRTKQFVELFDNPPEFLVEALRAEQQKVESGRERGIPGIAANVIGAGLVFEFMGSNRLERARIRAELKDLSKRVSQC